MGFLRIPFSLGVSVARWGIDLGFDVTKAVVGRVLPGQRSADDTVWAMPTAPPRPDAHARAGSASPAAAPSAPMSTPDPPPAPAPVPPPPPGARPAPPPFEPPPIPEQEAVLVGEFGDPADVGASVHVEGEPFPGYETLRAPEVVARLEDADESTRALVRLFERATKGRKTILDATER